MQQITIGIFLFSNILIVHLAEAKETRLVELAGKLNSAATQDSLPENDATFTEIESLAEVNHSLYVIDAVRQEKLLRLYFFKLAEPRQWTLQVYADGSIIHGGSPGETALLVSQNFSFNSQGNIENPEILVVITPDWPTPIPITNIEISLKAITTSATTSSIRTQFQDGCINNCPQSAGVDFDGDGADDQAIWRPSLGIWAIRKSSVENEILWVQWGLPGDIPMGGDYTGDRKADLVVWRPTNGTWYVCQSDLNFDCSQGLSVQFGLSNDKPLHGDFDGDSVLDYAIWRPSFGLFIYKSSRTGDVLVQQWGLPEDIPIGAFSKN